MSLTALDHVERCWSRIRQSSPVYTFFFSNITLVSASTGLVTAQLAVEAQHVNSKAGLHGSVSATIVDWAGGMAIASHGLEHTGLSVDLHVTYVSTAREGDVLTIEGRTNKVGRNLGFTSVVIWKGVEGVGRGREVVATGTHTKYILRDVEQKRNEELKR